MFDKGHIVNYNIGNFSIKETYTSQDNNYYFEIRSDKLNTNFQIKQNYKKSEKVIKKLEYREIDEYKCLLPTFKDGQILTDIMCTKDNIIYYANNLDKEKASCEYKNGFCNDYWDLFFRHQKTETRQLIDSIREKAIESYITLEKRLFPQCSDLMSTKK